MIRSLLGILTLVLLSATAVGHSTALAAGTLDQSYTAAWDSFADIDSSYTFIQTYTAGLTGTLVQVSVPLTNVSLSGSTPPLQVEIATPKDVPLDTVSIAPTGLPNWNVAGSGGCSWVTVTVSVPQVAGNQYAIVLSSNSPLTYGWCGTGASGYTGGAVYKSAPPGSKLKRVRSLGDLDFMTYVG